MEKNLAVIVKACLVAKIPDGTKQLTCSITNVIILISFVIVIFSLFLFLALHIIIIDIPLFPRRSVPSEHLCKKGIISDQSVLRLLSYIDFSDMDASKVC